MIKILNSELQRRAILKNIIEPNRFEEINGENTLTFSTILDEKASTYIDEDSILEIDGDYFDLVYYSKNQNEDGTLTIDVEAEHVSYRLNNYSLEYYTKIGTPTEILAELLTDTDFTVGTVEYSTGMTYSAQEAKSKRQMVMELVALLGGEIDFEKFEINILAHRGSETPRILTTGKNIKIISKVYNKRETDESGNPLVAYTCEPIQPTGYPFMLGDEVLLIQKDLDIQETLRIVRLGYDPYNPMTAEIELANFISGVEDQMYRIATTSVAKEKIYNGCKIGPEDGFMAARSDNKAKAIMNATEGISIYTDTGDGPERVFFVDLDGRIQANKIDIAEDGTFGGRVTAQHVILNDDESTGSLNFMNNGTYTTFKTNYTTGGNTLIIGRTTSLGATPSLLQRMDIFANWLYVYNNLYVANQIEIDGEPVATEDYADDAISSAINQHIDAYHSAPEPGGDDE